MEKVREKFVDNYMNDAATVEPNSDSLSTNIGSFVNFYNSSGTIQRIPEVLLSLLLSKSDYLLGGLGIDSCVLLLSPIRRLLLHLFLHRVCDWLVA